MPWRALFPRNEEGERPRTGLTRLLLVEGDRGRSPDRHTLPLVARTLVEADVEDELLRLTRLDDAETERADARHGLERRVAADADAELVQVETGTSAAERVGGDRLTELGDGRDGPGVGDVERLLLHRARLQVGEVQVEGVGAAGVVREGDGEGRGLDVDLTGVAGREVRDRGRNRDARAHADDDGGDGDLADVLLDAGAEGQLSPLSVTVVTIFDQDDRMCVYKFLGWNFPRFSTKHKDHHTLSLVLCQHVFANMSNLALCI